MDYRVHGILQVRILEWVAYPFYSGSFHPRIELGSPALQAETYKGLLKFKEKEAVHFLKGQILIDPSTERKVYKMAINL